jgi:hypothetical protein
MADPIAEIEVELRRPVVSDQDANKQRRNLARSFETLTPDQAAALLKRILTWNGSNRLPEDFRRPERSIRLELLQILVQKLGTQNAKQFWEDLTGNGPTHAPDPTLSRGLKMVFPDYTKVQRDKFLAALKTGPKPPSKPTVLLEFRNSGTFSNDNTAKVLETLSDRLGPSPVNGLNKMEIRGTVLGHTAGTSYRFDRTVAMREWYRVGDQWKPIRSLPEGSPDNTHNSDEDDIPNNDHIYSVDTPGLEGKIAAPNIADGLTKDATEIVFMMTAIETVEVKMGNGPWTQAGSLDWHSVTWLEKVGSSWRRKVGKNEIEQGEIPNLDDASEPPATF